MAEINVRVTDTTSGRTQKYRISTAILTSRLVEMLVRERKLATQSTDGQPVQYHLYRSSRGDWLAPYKSLQELGIEEGELLHLSVAATPPATIQPMQASLPTAPSRHSTQVVAGGVTAGSNQDGVEAQGNVRPEVVRVFDIALAQRRVLLCFLASCLLALATFLIPEDSPWALVLIVPSLCMAFAMLWSIAELTVALECWSAWLWLFLAPIPGFNFIVVLWLVVSATRELKKHGAAVGLLGVPPNAMRTLLHLPNTWSRTWVAPGLCAKRLAILVAVYSVTCCGWGMMLELVDPSSASAPVSPDPLAIQRDATLAYWQNAYRVVSPNWPEDATAKTQELRLRADALRRIPTLNVDLAAVEMMIELSTFYDQLAGAFERAGSVSTYVDAFLRGMSGDIAGPGRELSQEQKVLQDEATRIEGRLAYVRAALTSYYGVDFIAL